MSKKYLIELISSIVIVWQFVIAYIDSFGLFCKRSYSFHVFSKSAKSCSSKNVFMLINWLTILNWWNSMIIFTINSSRTTSTCKKQTKISSIFLIKQISSCISYIKFRITSCQCCLFFLLVLSTYILTIPKIILLISFLIRIIIRQTILHLFPSRSLLRIYKLNIFLYLFLSKLFRYITI